MIKQIIAPLWPDAYFLASNLKRKLKINWMRINLYMLKVPV